MVAIAIPNKPQVIIHSPVVRGMKAVTRGNGLIEGYLVSYGNRNDTDLEGQFFTPNTNFGLDWFSDRPLLYHHGMDGTMKIKCFGRIKTLEQRELGLWCQAQVDLADQYGRAVYNLSDTGKFGWSSGSAEHLVDVADDGEIKQWVLIEGSVTPTPAQPAKTTVTALKSVLPESFSIYLKGLHARVDTENAVNSNDNLLTQETKTMATKSTLAFVRAVLKAKGVQADEEQVKAIAEDPEVVASLGESEDPATMGMEDDALMAFGDEDDALMSFGDEGADPLAAFGDEDALMAFGDEDAFASLEDDTALMSLDDPDAIASADEEAILSAYRMIARRKALARKNSAKKSVPYGMTPALASYIKSLEQRVGAQERGVGKGGATKSVQVVAEGKERAQAAYKSVWWKYIRGGEGRLDESERRRLYTEGARDANVMPVKSALNVSDSASLAMAVPEDFVADLNKGIASATVMAQECNSRKTSSDRLTQPKMTPTDARRAYTGNIFHPGENPSAASETEANGITISRTEIPIHVHLVNKSVTLSSLEDVSYDLQAEMNDYFAELIAVEYDETIWAGSGQGRMKGVTVDPLVITSASTGTSSVSGYVPAGSTTDILADQLIKIKNHLAAQYRRNAKWYMNSNTLSIIEQIKDGEGRYVWTDDTGFQNGQPSRIKGFPIVISEFAPEPTSGNFPIIFGDMRLGYTIAKRVEFAVRRFEDLSTAVTDTVAFVGRARFGGQVTSEWALKVLKMATS